MDNSVMQPFLRSRQSIPWELSSDAPISIRAEGAWSVTRGSKEVTIAIIDSGFDLRDIPQGVCFEMRSAVDGDRHDNINEGRHGTLIAQLLCGSHSGYPGVAPRCRFVFIDLPLRCSEAEEKRAFELAIECNASVVCCAWGSRLNSTGKEESPSPAVKDEIQRLAEENRSGRGALVLFAARNSREEVLRDTYLDHSCVIGVAGVTASGFRTEPMDSDGRVIFTAPASDKHLAIGGSLKLPLGNSGPVALAAGVAALIFSANPILTAPQVFAIMRITAASWCSKSSVEMGAHPSLHYSRPSMLRADAAVELALGTVAEKPRPIVYQNSRVHPLGSDGRRHRHERRFLGGEHSYLGHLGARTIQKIYNAAGHDISRALFTGEFAPYTPSAMGAIFEPHVLELIDSFFGFEKTPSFRVPTFSQGVPWAYSVGLAADLYDSPIDLQEVVFSNHDTLNAVILLFNNEIDKKFRNVDDDINLSVSSFLERPSLLSEPKYLELAQKNYSHFAGDNLLFYLSHHLLAISTARKCAYSSDLATAANHFKEALLSEGFACHFLTDMFSSGHARIPRWAWMHGGLVDKDASDILAKLLHDHEGAHGVFLKNISDQMWWAKGDGGLLEASPVYDGSSSDLPLVGHRTALGIAALIGSGQDLQLQPEHLAASLVCASIADVLRHMAKGVPPSGSAIGGPEAPNGLLGYIMNHIPFAMPAVIAPDLSASITNKFGIAFSSTTFKERVQNVEELFETYKTIPYTVKWRKNHIRFFFWHLYSNKEEFKGFCDKYLAPAAIQQAMQYQIEHLRLNLSPTSEPSSLLYDVPMLVGGIKGFTTTLTEDYPPEEVLISPQDWIVPQEWKEAIPRKLLEVLTSETDGIWGLGL